MSIVVIGDIAWRDQYHVGDEAMTEVAVAELRARGFGDITLMAGHPSVAEEMYATGAVPRFGFRRQVDRADSFRQLDDLVETADRSHPTVAAIADAKAVVIAGGGNLNSRYFHHALDRACAARLARRFGVPVIVSSQTVGPFLREDDAELIRDLARSASLFGARERTSRAWLGDEKGVRHTMDDATGLRLSPQHVPSARYLVGSFAPNPEASGLGDEEYVGLLGATLARLSVQLDADVLLIPHVGAFGISTGADLDVHTAIARASGTARVRPMPLHDARSALGVMAGSILSVSTRYHPTVFAPMVGVPSIGLAMNTYSSIRMNGALENMGVRGFVAPTETVSRGGIEDMAAELIARAAEYRSHLEQVRTIRLGEFRQWWDAVAGAIVGAEATVSDLCEVPAFEPTGSWRKTHLQVTGVSERLDAERLKAEVLEVAISGLVRERAHLTAGTERLEAELAEARARAFITRSDLDRAQAELVNQQTLLASTRNELADARSIIDRRTEELRNERSRRAVRLADAVGRAYRKLRR